MIRTATAIVVLCAAGAAARADLLINGGFEAPVLPGLNQTINAPSTAITGWTLTSGSVDLVATGSDVLGTSQSGLQMLDINGSSAGTISQSFPTVVGRTYVVQLFYSNNPNPSFASPSYSASVSVTGNGVLFSNTLVHAGATADNMNWQFFEQPFVANSTTSTLQLQSLQSGFNGVYFDSVTVVPEPATALVCLPGALALLLSRGSWHGRRRGY